MTFLEWMAETIGPHWVVARRTPSLLARYQDAVFLSRQRFEKLKTEYEEAEAKQP